MFVACNDTLFWCSHWNLILLYLRSQSFKIKCDSHSENPEKQATQDKDKQNKTTEKYKRWKRQTP
jgi:hypothetical protein